jgi:sugar/nucleoside kinase (ribokinase family)
MAFDDLELPTGSYENVVGGAATYASLATSLFAPARIVAIVGRDFPEAKLELLRARGIDTSGVERAPGLTFRWKGVYAANLASRTTLDTQLNVFADFSPTLPAAYRESRFVLLGNIHPELQLRVLDQVQGSPFVAADTMNFWISGERKSLDAVLKRIHVLVVNDEELRLLTGEHSIRKAAVAVKKLGPEQLICKRGEHGSLLFDERGVFFAPPYLLEREIDPTGAGDTFAGAWMGHLARSGNVTPSTMRRSILMASAVASFCVEDVGTHRTECLTLAEANARLAEIDATLAC